MSLLSLAGLDLNKLAPQIVAQAKEALAADGIVLEDHLMEKLAPVLANLLSEALKDLQQIEAPVLERLDRFMSMCEPLVENVSALVKGGVSIVPNTPKSS
jgi:hypothetical protein